MSDYRVIVRIPCCRDDTAQGTTTARTIHFRFIYSADPSQTMLNCIDNSGATLVECVANLRMKRHGRIGSGHYDGLHFVY